MQIQMHQMQIQMHGAQIQMHQIQMHQIQMHQMRPSADPTAETVELTVEIVDHDRDLELHEAEWIRRGATAARSGKIGSPF